MNLQFALVIVTLPMLLSVRAYYDWSKDDWRTAARLLAQNHQPSTVILTDPDGLGGYLAFYDPELQPAFQPNGLASDGAAMRRYTRAWIVTLDKAESPALKSLHAQGWNSIRLDANPVLLIWYAGRASEEDLWREVAGWEVPPQVLIYSDALARLTGQDPLLARSLAARATQGAQTLRPPLLDAQRITLERKIRAAGVR